MYSDRKENFCILLRELPDVDNHTIPCNGRNGANAILSRWLAADVTTAAMFDDLTAALALVDGRTERLGCASAERTIRGEDLEGRHREEGKEIKKRNR